MDQIQRSTAGKCPVMHGGNTAAGQSNLEWWPKALNLDILHQHDTKTNPLGEGFDYRQALAQLDVAAVSNEDFSKHLSDKPLLKRAQV